MNYPETFTKITSTTITVRSTGERIPVIYALGESGKVYTFVWGKRAWREVGAYEEHSE